MDECKLIYRKNCITRNIDHNIKTNTKILGLKKLNYKKTFSALRVKSK